MNLAAFFTEAVEPRAAQAGCFGHGKSTGNGGFNRNEFITELTKDGIFSSMPCLIHWRVRKMVFYSESSDLDVNYDKMVQWF